MTYTATYSPDDNKLRLYAGGRLPADDYARVKAAGFRWAPKQDLFVAPMWTPDRADLLEELCGEIGDEDQSLADRAEERAERFEGYQENRAEDARRAREAVSAIADGIPLGQPILVGHHSERHARKDAERIENGMRKAIRMWDTAQYWKSRAAGAIRNAKYKELPAVRARRIKGIEADRRKSLATKARAAEIVKLFALVDEPGKWKPAEDGSIPSRHERAYFIAGRLSGGPYCAQVRLDGPNATTLHYHAYDVLAPDEKRYKQCPAMTVDAVIEIFAGWKAATDAYCDRWIEHYDHRLEYERAMLAEAGGLITERTEYPIVPGGRVLVRSEWLTVVRVNRKDGAICSVTTNARYVSVIGIENVRDYQPTTKDAAQAAAAVTKQPPIINEDTPGAVHMTKAEFDSRRKHSDFWHYKRVNAADEFAAYRQPAGWSGGRQTTIFFTDQKIKLRPRADETIERPRLPRPERVIEKPTPTTEREESPEERTHQAMKDSLRAGVQVVSTPQLFPTPAPIARRVVDLAEIQPGMRVLEPSAGTGALIDALPDGVQVSACEINNALCRRLNTMPKVGRVFEGDFLDLAIVSLETGTYDRIVMNPPFVNGSDIKHITHARKFLKPGGRLVAICANGPRQRDILEPEADAWIDLPAGSFKSIGTNVNTAIVVFTADDPEPDHASDCPRKVISAAECLCDRSAWVERNEGGM